MISAIDVIEWHKSQSNEAYSEDAIRWVLERWNNIQETDRPSLNQSMICSINKQINQISTGKRRLYGSAVLDITAYLSEHLQWEIPEKERKKLQDRENKWFENVRSQSENSERIYALHMNKLEELVKCHFSVDAASLAITLLFETAPVSITHLFYILTHPDVLNISDDSATIFFPVKGAKKGEVQQFARYKLSLLSFRLLENYFSGKKYPKNIRELRGTIQDYLSVSPFFLKISEIQQLRLIIQCHWQNSLPNFFMIDFCDPSNQFALPAERYRRIFVDENIKNRQMPIFGNTRSIIPDKIITRIELPHIALIKRYKKIGKNAVLQYIDTNSDIIWVEPNILPQLYYLYVAELIQYGGAKKNQLAISTLETYTNGHNYTNSNPLPLSVAMSEDGLNKWARDYYDNAESEVIRLHIFYFLRFVAEIELTDALDLEQFKAVQQPRNVDANLVTAKDLFNILNLLQDGTPEYYLQRLFSMIVVSLSFHACLRRGEILRLRLCDIRMDAPKSDLFHLKITNTVEGKTKNGLPRMVHVHLPAEQALLVRFVLKHKSASLYSEPLIGFSNEKYSSREVSYILPVTRAIKSCCGKNVRFHHLRHGGAFVLTNQMLTLFSDNSIDVPCPFLSLLLQRSFIETRFSYWIGNRPIENLNSIIALDEIANMLGHSQFSTTRMSYLHGHEWLNSYFSAIKQIYSKPMLRYLCRLKSGSNDISRRIKLLQDNNKSTPHHGSVELSCSRVTEMVLLSGNRLSRSGETKKAINSPQFLNIFVGGFVVTSSNFFDYLTKKYFDNLLEWEELNRIKLLIYSGLPPVSYKKVHLSLIKKWLGYFDDEKNAFLVLCNQCTANEYRILFLLPEFKIFTRKFMLFQNVKTSSSRQEDLIRSQFILKNETFSLDRVISGKTQLVIDVHSKKFSTLRLINLYREFYC